jgi:hypothetical protein
MMLKYNILATELTENSEEYQNKRWALVGYGGLKKLELKFLWDIPKSA